MKLFSTLILTVFIGISGFSQELSFKVSGLKDTTVNLVKYVGSKLYYADTAQLVNGKVTFDGSKHEPGIMALLMPGQRYFEFIHNNEKVHMETKSPNYLEHMIVKKSVENQIFLDYMNLMKASRENANEIQEKISKLDAENHKEKEELNAQLNQIGKDVVNYQEKIIQEKPNMLVSKIIKMSTDIQIPEAPKDEDGNFIDPAFGYKYLRDHYFDNIDLTDDRLVNTPVLQNKLEN